MLARTHVLRYRRMILESQNVRRRAGHATRGGWTMRVRDLITLYDYYYWATTKILAQAEKVTPEQWSGPPPIGDRSLQEILVHMLEAERAWRNGWEGPRR